MWVLCDYFLNIYFILKVFTGYRIKGGCHREYAYRKNIKSSWSTYIKGQLVNKGGNLQSKYLYWLKRWDCGSTLLLYCNTHLSYGTVGTIDAIDSCAIDVCVCISTSHFSEIEAVIWVSFCKILEINKSGKTIEGTVTDFKILTNERYGGRNSMITTTIYTSG